MKNSPLASLAPPPPPHTRNPRNETNATTGAAVADLFSVSPQVTGDLSALATAAVLGYGAAVERRLLDAEEEEEKEKQ